MSRPAASTDVVPSDEGVLYNDWGVFFWHPPAWPSQWTAITFTLDSQVYCCCEQAMMHRKAKLFGDTTTAQLILATDSPKEHKSLGRKVAHFDHALWGQHKEQIVYDINYAKYSQNHLFAHKLVNTGSTQLVEASALDNVWGVGMNPKDCVKLKSLKEAEKVWKGQNLLGKALMAVRSKLREERPDLYYE